MLSLSLCRSAVSVSSMSTFPAPVSAKRPAAAVRCSRTGLLGSVKKKVEPLPISLSAQIRPSRKPVPYPVELLKYLLALLRVYPFAGVRHAHPHFLGPVLHAHLD